MIATWQDALIAPNYTLDEVEDRVEERLEANLEGLTLGGEPVAEKLLGPALLEAPEPGYATAAALVLLRSGDASARDAVLDAVATAEGEQQEALVLALSAGPSDTNGLDHLLKQRFGAAKSEEETALWLAVLNNRRVHPGAHLKVCLGSKNPALLSEAIQALGVHYRPEYGGRYDR